MLVRLFGFVFSKRLTGQIWVRIVNGALNLETLRPLHKHMLPAILASFFQTGSPAQFGFVS
jgi:hypothetical protein